ncbi:hypothetical protein RchiOBHm_Chr6g0278991 [Rosa chinensis]|uniref:Uncharacterized protein n=1 Tax=Rosa chinensis TaxID=74649 RepID=A0A2P6PSV9_ROSCH|nr:hypothetical protein RchiOBHm_Chr6g0278991 [Rosa chinensis]
METSLIKSSSLNNVPNSHSPTFLSHNGFASPQLDVSDIEMIAIQTVTYTSLKDLLPAYPPTIGSPTHNSSWHEIPIKNPLVKHAALAYLQPMSTRPEVGGKGIIRTVRDKCGCTDGIGCLDWLRDVVWNSVREAFGEDGRREGNWDEDDDDDDDEDDYVKVD